MALNAAGIEISVDDFIDDYLVCTEPPFDPEKSFGGDPRSQSGRGCYAPVIRTALDKAREHRISCEAGEGTVRGGAFAKNMYRRHSRDFLGNY